MIQNLTTRRTVYECKNVGVEKMLKPGMLAHRSFTRMARNKEEIGKFIDRQAILLSINSIKLGKMPWLENEEKEDGKIRVEENKKGERYDDAVT